MRQRTGEWLGITPQTDTAPTTPAGSRTSSPGPSLARLGRRPPLYSSLRRDASSRFDPEIEGTEPGQDVTAHAEGSWSPYSISPGASSPYTFTPISSSVSQSPATPSFALVTPASFSPPRSSSPQPHSDTSLEDQSPPPYEAAPLEGDVTVNFILPPPPTAILPSPAAHQRPPAPPIFFASAPPPPPVLSASAPQPPPPPLPPLDDDEPPRTMSEPQVFTGESDNENPQDFLKAVKRSFIGRPNFSSDATKLEFFGLYLKSGSEAEGWFKEVTQPPQPAVGLTTWKDLEDAFNTKWPERPVTARTAAEKKALLEGTKLEEKDLGKKVKAGGLDEYSHIVWANRVEKLANDIPDTSNLLVDAIRARLPKAIRKLIGNKNMTWREFAKAVRELTATEILAQLDEEKEVERYQQKLNELVNQRSAASRTTTQYPQLPLQPTPQTPAPPNYRLPRAPLPQTSRFAPPAPLRPDSERLVDVRTKAVAVQPDTPAGKAEYDNQVAAWSRLWAGQQPTELRPYPLTPGTSAVASGECWTCGRPNHRRGECQHPPVPELEQKWRSIAGMIAQRARREAANVNLVSMGYQAGNAAHGGHEPTITDYETLSNENAILWDMFRRLNMNQGNAEGSPN